MLNHILTLNDWSEVEDDSGIAYYRIEYKYDDEHHFSNEPYRKTSDGTTTQRNHTPGIKEDGGVRFRVQAFDNAGNEGTWSEWRHYYYIDSDPVVSLVSPEDNFITNQGGFVQSWSIDDFHKEHIDHYEYRSCWNNPTEDNDECNLLHEKNNLTSTSRTVGKQGDKTFWWQVRAVDKAGNIGDWADARKAILDSTPPVVDITSPLGTYVKGSVEIKGSVEDLHPDHYYLVIKDSNGQILQDSPRTVPSYDSFTDELLYTWNTTLFADGEYTIHLAAKDFAGNRDDSVSLEIATVIVDNHAPIADITSHEDGAILSGEVNILGNITEDNIRNYNLSLNQDTEGLCNKEDTWNFSNRIWAVDGNTTTVNHILNTNDYSDGSYMIRLAARDLALNRDPMANSGEGVSVEVICITIDNTPPETLFDDESEELSGKYVNDDLVIKGVSTDESGIDFVTLSYRKTGNIDWIEIIKIENPQRDLPFNWEYTWIPSENGTYDIKASATDILGNQEQSPTIDSVTYDTVKPNITLLQIIQGILSIDAEDDLSGYEKIEFRIDEGEWITYSSEIDLLTMLGNKPGTYIISVSVVDKAGNPAEGSVTLIIFPPTPSTQTGIAILGLTTSPLKPTPVQASYGIGGYLLAQTNEQDTEQEEITEEQTVTQDSPEVKGEEDNEELNGEEETTKWWIYPLVILPVLAIFLILWKRRKEDNEPQF